MADTEVTAARAPAALEARMLEVVRQYWGYDTLRPLQAEAIRAGLEQRDSLVVMPTGGGKSLCYQVPPMIADAPGRMDVVVSPLISLMKDQVDGLRACGYPAAAIHSGLTPAERTESLDGIRDGRWRLLFVSPERLVMGGFQQMLAIRGTGAFAIDEAHCISHWGHDFRPEYRQLASLKERFAGASIHAFTATATPRVQQDVIDQLRLDAANVLIGRADRPNLTYRIVPRVDLNGQVLEVVRRHPEQAVIVYCITRKETEALAAMLKANGVNAGAYHAGMDATSRRRTQEAFSTERLDVVTATVAFGMGIDRSDVRCVVHAAMPKSIEHYQQETGRAGRDGLEAECVLLYSAADVLRWKGLMERAAAHAREDEPVDDGGPGPSMRPIDADPAETVPPAEAALHAQLELLRHMQGVASTLECRHRALSRYFGQAYEAEACGACDVCLDEVEAMPDSTVIARKLLSCVARMDQRWGVGQVVAVARGADTETVRRAGHDQLSTYGILEELPEKALTNLVYQLVDQELLVRSTGDRPLLTLNERSLEVLRGEREARFIDPRVRGGAVARTKAEAASWEGVDRGLFEHLREVRRSLAHERSVPPYVIFADNALREMARMRPTTLGAMRGVKGVGEKKLADLGPTFVDAIERYCDANAVEVDVDVVIVPARPSGGGGGGRGGASKSARANPERDRALAMFADGASVDDVEAATGRTVRTVVGYLAEHIEAAAPASIDQWVPPDIQARIRTVLDAAAEAEGADPDAAPRLKPMFDALGGTVPYEQIRLVVAHRAGRARTTA